MDDIKVEDYVICIKPDSAQRLVKNKIYKVLGVDNTYSEYLIRNPEERLIGVIRSEPRFFSYRFKKLPSTELTKILYE